MSVVIDWYTAHRVLHLFRSLHELEHFIKSNIAISIKRDLTKITKINDQQDKSGFHSHKNQFPQNIKIADQQN